MKLLLSVAAALLLASCACLAVEAAPPVLRVTVIGAKVNAVDRKEPPAWHEKPFLPWNWFAGKQKTTVKMIVQHPDRVFSKEKEVKTRKIKDNLAPSFMEQFSFGPRDKGYDIFYIIEHDKNVVDEGRIDLTEFYDQDATTSIDLGDGQKLDLRITWNQNETCPPGAKPSGWLFFKDEQTCECKEDYMHMGPSGTCEAWPTFLKTCAQKPCRRGERCWDKDFEDFLEGKKCQGASAEAPCDFFTCRSN